MSMIGFSVGIAVLLGIGWALFQLSNWPRAKTEMLLRMPAVERVVEKVDSRFSWRDAREMMDSRHFRYLPLTIAFFPLVVTAVSVPGGWFDLKPPGPLVFLYIAAVLVTICNIFYLLFCPPFVKRYRNPSDVDVDGWTIQTIRREASRYLTAYFSDNLWLGESAPAERTFRHERLKALFLQYRVVSADFSAERKTRREMRDLAAEINQFAPRVDKNGHYRLSANKGSASLTISQEQLFRHLVNDLMEVQRYSFPLIRVLMLLMLGIALILAFVPVISSAMIVWEYYFPPHNPAPCEIAAELTIQFCRK